MGVLTSGKNSCGFLKPAVCCSVYGLFAACGIQKVFCVSSVLRDAVLESS